MGTFAAISCWALVGALIASALRPVAARSASATAPGAISLAPAGVIEVLTAAIFAALAYRVGPRLDLLAFSALAATGVPLAAADFAARKLPNLLVGAAYLTVLPLFGLDAALHGKFDQFARALLGMGAALAVHAVMYMARAIAGGDLKLTGVLGAALGWISWSATWTGVPLGWLLAAATVLATKVISRKQRRPDVPLGPFLIAGAIATMLVLA